jgi:uncharacterized protein YqjF (DUF2071 family)
MTSDFRSEGLQNVDHRPWPVPAAPWVMTQTWSDVLFAHWPIERAAITPFVPSAFELDVFDGHAWLGVVPFLMSNVGPRGAPALPGVSRFPELNVRTYVTVDDKPGVYFFSLDASSWLAVRTARLLLRLPYYTAAMAVSRTGGAVAYQSRRTSPPSAAFAAEYRPVGPVFHARPGSIEHFLAERYCLYARNHRGHPYRLDIHHARWPLQLAEAEISLNGMASAAGIALPDTPPLLHYAKRQDTIAWMPTTLHRRPPVAALTGASAGIDN